MDEEVLGGGLHGVVPLLPQPPNRREDRDLGVLDALVFLGPLLDDQMRQPDCRARSSYASVAMNNHFFICIRSQQHISEDFQHLREGVERGVSRYAVVRPPRVLQLADLSRLDAQIRVLKPELSYEEIWC